MAAHLPDWHPLTKFLIIGPYNAGKTTFVRSISEAFYPMPAPVDKRSTVERYMDSHGSMQVNDDLTLCFFDTPSHRRFDYLWEMMAREAAGYVLMQDSTRT